MNELKELNIYVGQTVLGRSRDLPVCTIIRNDNSSLVERGGVCRKPKGMMVKKSHEMSESIDPSIII